MKSKRIGQQTIALTKAPVAVGWASVTGKTEGEGPLGSCFDQVSQDSRFGRKTWEQGEGEMLRRCFHLACHRAGVRPRDLDFVLSGDLQNQCMGSALAMRSSKVPFIGLYGACSTMAESLCLGALLVDGGAADRLCAATGSHFCASERQFRFPLEYGGIRTPTAQWTVTGSGAVVLSAEGRGPKITHVTMGQIVDKGITDSANMGAAMAPAACHTLLTHFRDTDRSPTDYDAIFTGDLGAVGYQVVLEQLGSQGYDLSERYYDCGLLIFDPAKQDVHAGGSGCGCAASVLCGYILPKLRSGEWKRVLFSATGALLSATSTQQGLSIPGICHALVLEGEGA